jgi:hypothetical protein
MATQSWLNSKYRRGLSMHPCGARACNLVEHAPLCVEDQQSGGVVSYLHHRGAARQEVQDPIAQGGVQTQGPELNDELGAYYGVEG